MSRSKTVVCRLDLGQTRVAGYTIYNETTKAFEETTPRDVKNLIEKNEVNGLQLREGAIELDAERFNMRNLMVKSAVGRFRTLVPTTSIVNCMYAVVRVIETDNGRIYETVNNQCARVKVTIEKLNMLMEMGYVAGVRRNDNGEIEICEGVAILDKRSKIELSDNKSYTEFPEVEQLLGGTITVTGSASIDGGNNDLQSEQCISAVLGEPDKDTNIEMNPSVEKEDSIDVIFDILDITKNSSDTTEENQENAPSQEQVDENNKVRERKTRKK